MGDTSHASLRRILGFDDEEEQFGRSENEDDGYEKASEDENERKMVEEDVAESEQEDVQGHVKRGGRLSSRVKRELEKAQAEYEAKVASIAAEANKNVHTCWRHLNERTYTVRNVSSFNAYQAWCRVHGEYVQPDDMDVQDWNRFVAAQYCDILETKLQDEDRDDEELRRNIFADKISWYEEHHDAFIEKKKVEGKFRGTVKSMLKPLYALGIQMYRNVGAHLLGHLVITDPDADSRSRSVSWGCTEVVKQVIEDNAVHLPTQLTDIEMMLRFIDTFAHGQKKFICGELMKNWRNCGLLASRPKPSQQEIVIVEWFHAVLHMILCQLYDFYASPQERCTGSKSSGLSPGQFVKNAYKYHVRVINWPVGIPFCGVKPVEDLHAMSCTDIKKVTGPRIAQIMHKVNGGEDDDEVEKCFEVVSWDEDESKLSLEDQARVPIVSDTQGNTVVTVSYSETYQKEVKQDIELRGNKNDNNSEFYEDNDVSQPSRQQPDKATNKLKPQPSQFAARLLHKDQPNLHATPHPCPRTQVDKDQPNVCATPHPCPRTQVDKDQPNVCATPHPHLRTQVNSNSRPQPTAESANPPTLHPRARTEGNVNHRPQPIVDAVHPRPRTQLNTNHSLQPVAEAVNQPNGRPIPQPRPRAQVNIPAEQATKQPILHRAPEPRTHTQIDLRASRLPSKAPCAYPQHEAQVVPQASSSQPPHPHSRAVPQHEQQLVAHSTTSPQPPQPPRPRPRPLHPGLWEQGTEPNLLKRKRDQNLQAKDAQPVINKQALYMSGTPNAKWDSHNERLKVL
ncbi:hypothetical protein EV361DRAFT_979691 [Lentinula raphanica]|nr:hypothetical protein EV361DRAFT_979691 [Lentinula raphanica]